MNDIYVTLSGNVTHEPRQFPLGDGSRVTSIRVATSRRYLDRQTQEWLSAPPTYFAVRCYRGLADNAAQSIRRGQPVVVHGRLRIREFERDGRRRFTAEVEASSIGHDLKWGIATFEKPLRAARTSVMGEHEREEPEDSTIDWEQGDTTICDPAEAVEAAADEGVPWPTEERLPAEERLVA